MADNDQPDNDVASMLDALNEAVEQINKDKAANDMLAALKAAVASPVNASIPTIESRLRAAIAQAEAAGIKVEG